MDFKKMNIEDIEKMSKNDRQKADEMKVADRFIKYLNRVCNTDYILSEKQPQINYPIDVEAHSKSIPSKVLKMQVTVSNRKTSANIGKESAKQRSNNNSEFFLIEFDNINIKEEFKEIITSIKCKGDKYKNLNDKIINDIILLLDGWWTIKKLSEMEINELRILIKEIFKSIRFKEIWFVGFDKSYILYP